MTAKQPPDDKIASGIVIILILLGFTVIAGFNDKAGKVMMMVMGGFTFVWFLTAGGPLLKQWFGQVGESSAPAGSDSPKMPSGQSSGLKLV